MSCHYFLNAGIFRVDPYRYRLGILKSGWKEQ